MDNKCYMFCYTKLFCNEINNHSIEVRKHDTKTHYVVSVQI